MNLNKNIPVTGGVLKILFPLKTTLNHHFLLQISYYGEGLDKGQCGVTINNVDDNYNGIVSCFLGLPSELQEPSGVFLLTVARKFFPIYHFGF